MTDPKPNSKIAWDLKKIRDMEASGTTHAYNHTDWRPWTGNNYIKSYYDVTLSNGIVLKHILPNAGLLRRGKMILDKESGVFVRLSTDLPF